MPEFNNNNNGPSDLQAQVEELQREIALLRQGSHNGGSVRVSRLGSTFSASSDTVVSGLKILTAIDKVKIPDDTPWQGSGDTRSAKGFLHKASRISNLAGLGNEALFKYFVNRCVSTSLATEIDNACSDEILMGDYKAACEKLAEYFNERFANTNRPDRLIERFEKGSWAHGVTTIDEFYRRFSGLVKETELLDTELHPTVLRRFFVSSLPERLRTRVRDFCRFEDKPIQLTTDLAEWMAQCGGEEQFFKSAGVRAARPTQSDEISRPQGVPRRNLENCICFFCRKPGHIQSDCQEFKDYKKAHMSRDQSTPHQAPPMDKDKTIPWSGSVTVVTSAAASIQRRDMMEEVTVRSLGAPKTVYAVGLLDSGSQRTLCSKALADTWYQGDAVHLDDTKPTEIQLRMANGNTGAALGTINMVINDVKVSVIVMETVSGDLILGEDVLRRCPKLLRSLVTQLSSVEQAEALIAEIVEANRVTLTMGSDVDDNVTSVEQACMEIECKESWPKPAHAHMEPIKLVWKSDDRPALNSRVAKREADRMVLGLQRRDPAMLDAYDKVFAEWSSKGWLVPVPPEEARFCMRHFPVRKQDAITDTGKCRLVVDGSPLSQFLVTGECSHRDMQRVLLLWRLADGFSLADISSAYMRIPVSDADGLFLCIWWRGTLYRFASLPMGIAPSAAFLQHAVDKLLDTWLHSFKQDAREVVPRVVPVPYMDDMICLIFNEEGKPYVTPVLEDTVNHSLADYFNCRGMTISTEKLANSISCTKLLGVRIQDGNIVTDCPKLRKFDVEKGITRRRMLKCTAQLYDPFGFIAELCLSGRLLTAKASGVPWDHPVETSLAIEFVKWLKLVVDSFPLVSPRKLTFDEVVVCTDASRLATGVIVLLKDESGCWQRYWAKAEMLKKHQRGWTASSKLELLGILRALTALRRILLIMKESLDFTPYRIVLATDSEVNVQRIANPIVIPAISDPWERRTIVEVSNIAKKMGVIFTHVDGKSNPADHLSRGTVSPMHGKICNDAAEKILHAHEKLVIPQRVVYFRNESGRDRTIECHRVAEEPITCCTVNLTKRFEQEARGQTFSEWMKMYQDEDEYVRHLNQKEKLELVNGLWTIAGRQDLSGHGLRRIVLPKLLFGNLMKQIHDEGGHYSGTKMELKVKNEYHFRNLGQRVRSYCRSCKICQEVRGTRKWSSPPQYQFSDGKVFSVVGIDVMKVDKEKLLLTLTDLYSRYLFCWSIHRETSEVIIKHLSRLFVSEGSPKVVVCDNGRCFSSQEFRMFLSNLGVKIKYIPRHSPFFGGFYERSHLTLIQTMLLILKENAVPVERWKKVLPIAVAHMNRRPFESHTSPSLSPWEVFKGRRLPSCVDTPLPVIDPRPTEEQIEDNLETLIDEQNAIKEDFEEIWRVLRERSYKTIARRWVKSDIRLKVGDKVMRWINRRSRTKLESAWQGPYIVEELRGEARAIVDGIEEHVYNLRKYVERTGSETLPVEQPVISPSPHIAIDDEEDIMPSQSSPRRKRKASERAEERIKFLVENYEEQPTSKRTKRVAAVTSVPAARGMLLWI